MNGPTSKAMLTSPGTKAQRDVWTDPGPEGRGMVDECALGRVAEVLDCGSSLDGEGREPRKETELQGKVRI